MCPLKLYLHLLVSDCYIFCPMDAFSVKMTSTSTSTPDAVIDQARPPTTLSKGDRVGIRARKYPPARSKSQHSFNFSTRSGSFSSPTRASLLLRLMVMMMRILTLRHEQRPAAMIVYAVVLLRPIQHKHGNQNMVVRVDM
jgi:hypothetical protein